MFTSLSSGLTEVLRKLRGRGVVSDSDLRSAMADLRRALLEADVNYKVAKAFAARVEERAGGAEVARSLTPGQMIGAIVHEELASLLGGDPREMRLPDARPLVVMLVGLQGSGKTSAAAKLALWCKARKWAPQLVAADLARPAAVEQLRVLGEKIGAPVFSSDAEPTDVCVAGVRQAREHMRDVAIVDTAGRSEIDAPLMRELAQIKKAISPHETFLVVDSMTGQQALSVAKGFADAVGLTGAIVTKLDGDARGGAVLSVREVAGVPIMFASVGEGPEDFERFHPRRMADRILGLGDVATLVEKTKQAVSAESAERAAKKLAGGRFDLNDFREQLQALKKMGPLSSVVKMIPGLGRMVPDDAVDEGDVSRIEAMILSMTGEERRRPEIIDGSRRKRIARGSGTSVQDVGALLKQFEAMKKMVRGMKGIRSGKHPLMG